jgi:hypothetical protein
MPGAGAEHGEAVDQATLEFVEEPAGGEQPRHRGALAAGQHDGVEPVEIGRGPHQRRCRAELFQTLPMEVEGALEREHTDREAGPRSCGCHQPRSA